MRRFKTLGLLAYFCLASSLACLALTGPAYGRYLGLTSIALDKAGNIYVAGNVMKSWKLNYVVIKYTPAGNLSWARTYNGPDNLDDSATALALDGKGNLYVTGYSTSADQGYDFVTMKYTTGGTRVWIKRYKAHWDGWSFIDKIVYLGVDSQGNAYVTGPSIANNNLDIITLKYTSGGVLDWAKRYNGRAKLVDVPGSLAVDAQDNICVTGASDGTDGTPGFITLKYTPAGALTWSRRYSPPTGSYSLANSLAVDKTNGKIYVSGYYINVAGNFDYLTNVYSPGGALLKQLAYNGDANSDDQSLACTVDSSGNFYQTGWSGNGVNYDFLTIKSNADGWLQWLQRYDGQAAGAKGDESPTALAVDQGGNVYVTGYSGNDQAQGSNFLTLKYNSGGGLVWKRTYSVLGCDDRPAAMAIDGSGNIIVAGGSLGSSGSKCITIKYTPGGSRAWVRTY